MVSRIQEGGGGMGSSGGFRASKKDKGGMSGKIVYTLNADGSMSKPQTIKKNIKTIVKAKKAETKALIKSTSSRPPLATPKSGVKVLKPVLNSGARNANEQGRVADMKYAADHARALAEKRVAAGAHRSPNSPPKTPIKNQMMDIENSMARARNAGEIKPKVIKINSK